MSFTLHLGLLGLDAVPVTSLSPTPHLEPRATKSLSHFVYSLDSLGSCRPLQTQLREVDRLLRLNSLAAQTKVSLIPRFLCVVAFALSRWSLQSSSISSSDSFCFCFALDLESPMYALFSVLPRVPSISRLSSHGPPSIFISLGPKDFEC